MNQIDPIHTCCKNCIFSVYEGNTQISCALNYIDKYKQNNVNILEAYDEDKEFFILDGKKCIGYREDKWFDQFDLKDNKLETKIAKYHEDNKLDYAIVINLKTMNLEDTSRILKQINLSGILPSKLVFIRYADQKDFSYQNINNLIVLNNIKYEWRIQSMVDNDISYIEILHNFTMINTKFRFFIGVEKYSDDLEKLIITMNSLVHEQLSQFIVISTKDYNCLGYAGGVYRYGAIVDKKHIFTDKNSFLVI